MHHMKALFLLFLFLFFFRIACSGGSPVLVLCFLCAFYTLNRLLALRAWLDVHSTGAEQKTLSASHNGFRQTISLCVPDETPRHAYLHTTIDVSAARTQDTSWQRRLSANEQFSLLMPLWNINVGKLPLHPVFTLTVSERSLGHSQVCRSLQRDVVTFTCSLWRPSDLAISKLRMQNRSSTCLLYTSPSPRD